VSAVANLRLISIVCNTTEDTGGADETYLLVSGVKQWGQPMNDNDVADLGALPDIPFGTKARVDLYDQDSPDEDDHLGTFYARPGMIGQGELEYTFFEDGANYRLTYQVVP
jgi:hypothetical protein